MRRRKRPAFSQGRSRSDGEAARQGPRDLDFNVLGIWFRVFFDVGIREQDHRGMVKSNGAAA